MDHNLRPSISIYAFDVFNLCQIVLLPAGDKNSSRGLRFKLCDNTPSQKAGTAGDKNTPICPETHDACRRSFHLLAWILFLDQSPPSSPPALLIGFQVSRRFSFC